MVVARTLLVIGLAMLVQILSHDRAAAGGNGGDDEADFPHFFGFVKDTDGNAIPSAKVSAAVTAAGAVLVSRTDATGAYMIPMFKETDAARANITCSKDGYRFKEVQRRNPTAPPGTSAEVDCILER